MPCNRLEICKNVALRGLEQHLPTNCTDKSSVLSKRFSMSKNCKEKLKTNARLKGFNIRYSSNDSLEQDNKKDALP